MREGGGVRRKWLWKTRGAIDNGVGVEESAGAGMGNKGVMTKH